MSKPDDSKPERVRTNNSGPLELDESFSQDGSQSLASGEIGEIGQNVIGQSAPNSLVLEGEPERTVQHRLIAFAALVVFAFLTFTSAPYIAGLFPTADMGEVPGAAGLIQTSMIWGAVQLYLVLCASALFPAFLWFAWLRRFGGPVAVTGLEVNHAPLRSWFRGAVAGAGLILLLGALLFGAGWYRADAATLEVGYLVPVLVGLVFAALYEELLFRGFGYWAMSRIGGHWLAILFSSVLFGWAHAGNSGANVMGLINTVLAGVVLGLLRWRSGNLWAAWGVHLGWNAALGLVLGARTSGFAFAGRLVEAEVTEVGGRYLVLAGGEYGPEGSLVLTPLLVGWGVWLVVKGRRGGDEVAGA